MKKMILATAIALLGVLAPAWGAQSPPLWIEGEQAARRDVHPNAWFEAVDPLELSGGAQIANFSEENQPGGWAEYDITMPVAGPWRFWLRANPCSGIQYNVDGGAWAGFEPKAMEEADRAQRRTRDYVPRVQQKFNVAADGRHDARTMTWFDLGSLTLPAGKHTLRFSLGGETPKTKRFAVIDCFVLTMGDFAPNYQYKPGEEARDLIADPPEATWIFDPARDEFSPGAALDLRGLNEDAAGQHGFIGLKKT